MGRFASSRLHRTGAVTRGAAALLVTAAFSSVAIGVLPGALAAPPAGAATSIVPESDTVASYGIVCADATHCMVSAVEGNRSSVLADLSGTTISDPIPVPVPTTEDSMEGLGKLVCPTSSTCYGVGTEVEGSTPVGYVEPILYGVVEPTIEIPDVTGLNSIACETGTTNCVAVGSDPGNTRGGPNDQGAVVDLSGGNEVGSAVIVSGAEVLVSVACEPGTFDCVAAGIMFTPSFDYSGGILPINGGIPGTVQDISSLTWLTQIDCSSSTSCLAAETSGVTDVVPISSEVAGAPIVASSAFNNLSSVTCASAAVCYVTGQGPDPSTGAPDGMILPVTNGVPGTVDLVPGTDNIDQLSCPAVTECVAAAQIPFDGDYEGAVVGDALPLAPATISSVSLSGGGAGLTVTVTGTNFGSFAPATSPGVPVSCESGDTSYDFANGELGFSDETEGWSAGLPGNCIGLIVDSWSNTKIVLSFGDSYVYPLVSTGDSYEVTVLGTPYDGTAPTIVNLQRTVSAVTFTGTSAKPKITVTGKGFPAHAPWVTGSPGCVSPDASETYESGSFSFSDDTQGWGGGVPGDCLGLTVSSWTTKKIVFGLGAYYGQVTSMLDGDTFDVDVLCTDYSGTVAGLTGPQITGVSFTGLGADDTEVTVTGTGFGSKPSGAAHPYCVKDGSVDFPTGAFEFSDLSDYWNAGTSGDCIGVVVKTWTPTEMQFTFGSVYADYTPVASGDQYQLIVKDTVYQGYV